MDYYYSTVIHGDFADAVGRVREALKTEGFGVISEIDIQKTLKDKIGVDFRPYLILGACNPTLAHEALQLEDCFVALPTLRRKGCAACGHSRSCPRWASPPRMAVTYGMFNRGTNLGAACLNLIRIGYFEMPNGVSTRLTAAFQYLRGTRLAVVNRRKSGQKRTRRSRLYKPPFRF
jgi:hypothetical protein